jgi:hypothetical protein
VALHASLVAGTLASSTSNNTIASNDRSITSIISIIDATITIISSIGTTSASSTTIARTATSTASSTSHPQPHSAYIMIIMRYKSEHLVREWCMVFLQVSIWCESGANCLAVSAINLILPSKQP